MAVPLSLWLLVRNPPESITDRKSAWAMIWVPRVIRDFPVEKYAGAGDSFIYRRQRAGDGWRQWCLEIDTVAENLDRWNKAFDNYLAERANSIQRPGGRMRMVLFRSDTGGVEQGWVTFQSAEPAGKLTISFGYSEMVFAQRMLRTRLGRLLALVFRRIGLPIDTITWPS